MSHCKCVGCGTYECNPFVVHYLCTECIKQNLYTPEKLKKLFDLARLKDETTCVFCGSEDKVLVECPRCDLDFKVFMHEESCHLWGIYYKCPGCKFRGSICPLDPNDYFSRVDDD